MARNRKKSLPKVSYPRGRRRVPEKTTARTYPYRVRRTSRGLVPATQDDLLPFIASRIAQPEAAEQATPEA
ncbi:hypothetical protein [Sphaerobacter thermophilus]|uniref:Uncharacterized protein n=1 Tax=Sphaerobacter thermophilus (strain ATCC 49802 / DSM 20745 / KCCM 41009 / NCIMB 13125 / S 6022) TaxID=479434 RepID=D1C8J8_SPHTD|nr:hypothetical protein [Sphaerobacter thermophilus]ACZ40141.1 hypothetical protein Sthe_2727 [Sphaerobacter thermophilus DSM 20745]PZN64680.1 MAG: hypothetical protein DIU58_08535 [Sphaerobacter thermophilus]